MAAKPNKTGLKEPATVLCPLVDTVRLMLGAARHAFNRHSQAELEKMALLQRDFTLAIDPLFQEVEAQLRQTPEAEKPEVRKWQTVLGHLEFMAHSVSGLADPIRLKGNRGAILSERDFFLINDLFSQMTGLMRALVDICRLNDPSLKTYVLTESQRMKETCFREEVEHETRMMDSPGQPGAWSVYVAILAHFRDTLGHLTALMESLN
jgi:Na+/phosphate symporter